MTVEWLERYDGKQLYRHPTLVICETEAGAYAPEPEEMIACHIRQARADVLLVAYSSVPQEKLPGRYSGSA